MVNQTPDKETIMRSEELTSHQPDTLKQDFSKFINFQQAKVAGLLPATFVAPLIVVWELTKLCNLRCLHCYNNSGDMANHSDLSDDVLLDIAQQLVDIKVVSVCLSGGEPMIRKNVFFSIAQLLKRNGILLSTITNGSLVTSDSVKELEKYFYGIQVSIDGAKPETHDFIRSRNGSFEKAIEAIKLLSNSNINELHVAFVANSYNYLEFGELVDSLATYQKIKYIQTQTIVFSGRATENNELILSNDQHREFLEIIAEKKAQYKNNIHIIYNDPTMHIRKMLRGEEPNYVCQIMADGNMAVNQWVPIVTGNINDDRILNIWNKNMSNYWLDKRIQNALLNFETINESGINCKRYIDPFLNLEDL